jgi:HPt (histidine-containing phosphotransfer) domain-containing protein
VRQHRYDLILMDVQMPVMDGLEATRALRAMPEAAKVPILAMTADAFGERRDACLAAGMDGHVAKPVDPALLYVALQRWLPDRSAATVPPRPARAGSATAQPGTAPPPPIEGIDTALALQYLGGRVDIYERVLRQFRHHYDDPVADVQGRLRSADRRKVQEAAHSIRGAASSLGARELADLASEVERQCALPDNEANLHRAASNLGARLKAQVLAVDDHLQRQAAAPQAPVPQLPAGAMDRLEAALAVGDYQAMVLHRDLHDALRSVGGPEATDLGTHLRRFDFAQALGALRALRQKHNV